MAVLHRFYCFQNGFLVWFESVDLDKLASGVAIYLDLHSFETGYRFWKEVTGITPTNCSDPPHLVKYEKQLP